VMDSLEETPYKVYTSQSAMTDTVLNDILAQIQPMFVSAPRMPIWRILPPIRKTPLSSRGKAMACRWILMR